LKKIDPDLRRLDAVILIRVISKVERKRVWGGSPATDRCQWPRLEDFLCSLIQAQDGVLGDPKQPRHQLILPRHFLLDQKERDPISIQGTSILGIEGFCIQFRQPHVLPVLEENLLLNPLVLDVGHWEEVLEARKDEHILHFE